MGNRRVRKITIQGFRSFPDTVTFDLSGGFACIADPEGNGAEDLFDALSFIAGRPAPGGRDRAGWLFKGNDTRDPASRAEVSVLTEGDASEKEARVSRVLKSTGEDEYYIDDRKCTEKEAMEILSAAGIYGYSLIDRNAVTDFLSSRYGAVGSLIDGASGADRLRKEADEEEEELSEKRKELAELKSRLEVYREKRRAFQDEAVRVSTFRDLRKRLRENEINIMLRRIEQLEKDCDTAEIRISELDNRIADREKERSETELRIKEMQISQRNLENEETKARSVFLSGRKDIDAQKLRIGVIDGKISTVDQKIDILNRDLAALRAGLEKEKQKINGLEKQGLKIADQLMSAEQNIKQSYALLEEKQKEVTERSVEYEEAVAGLMDRRSRMASLEAGIQGVEELRDHMEGRRRAIADSLEAKKASLPDGRSREEDLKKRSLLMEEKEKAALLLTDLTESLKKLKKKEEELFLEQRDRYHELSAEESRRDLLSDQEKDYESYDSDTISLLKEASVSGVHDMAGELLRVNNGYENVIAAALGRHTQDVICDDLASASAAADFLKERNAGRMTFIPLKELEYKYRVIPSELLIADGYLGRVLDFVEFDPVFSRAFQYLLGDTVVFRDFESAVKAGRFKGIRIVTMNSEIITDSEVLEGGALRNAGTRVFQRRNSLSESASRVNELEQEYKTVRSAYESTLAEEKKTGEQIDAVRSDIEKITGEISELSLRAELAGRQAAEADRSVGQLQEELGRHDKESEEADLSSRILDLTEQYRNAESESERFGRRSETLYLQLEGRKVEIRELEARIIELTSGLYASRCDAGINQLAVEQSVDARKSLEEAIQEKTRSVDEIRKERTSLEREKEQLERKVRKLEIELADRVRVLSSFREDRDSLRSQMGRFLNDKEKAENEYIQFRLEKRALGTERDSFAAQAEEMKKRVYEVHHIPYTEAVRMKSPVFVLKEGLKESERLRNLLSDYKEVNTAAPEEAERLTELYFSLDEKRRQLEDEVSALKESTGVLRAKAPAVSRRLFEEISSEFEKVFQSLSEDSGTSAWIKMVDNSEISGIEADIHVRRKGYTARKLLRADPEDQRKAFLAFVTALHTVMTPSLTFIDSIDGLFSPEEEEILLENLREKAGESLMWITGNDRLAGKASSGYVFLKQSNGTGEFRQIPLDEFRVYTPEREI